MYAESLHYSNLSSLPRFIFCHAFLRKWPKRGEKFILARIRLNSVTAITCCLVAMPLMLVDQLPMLYGIYQGGRYNISLMLVSGLLRLALGLYLFDRLQLRIHVWRLVDFNMPLAF
jgi:hypothetical protein